MRKPGMPFRTAAVKFTVPGKPLLSETVEMIELEAHEELYRKFKKLADENEVIRKIRGMLEADIDRMNEKLKMSQVENDKIVEEHRELQERHKRVCETNFDLMAANLPLQPKANFEAFKSSMIGYMKTKMEENDWHAVSDAANDLRVLEAKNGI